jgi:hypothetical protein
VGVEVVDDVEEVVEDVAVDVAALAVPFPIPDGPRFSYAAQSALGSAGGQLLAWHKDSSCGPCA